MTKEQDIKLEKVDDKTAYENLLVKYAELENKIADIKANCDLAIEGRDVKIMELEKENAELKAIERMALYSKMSDQLTKAKEIIKDLLEYGKGHWLYSDIKVKAEQFLKEIEK